MSVAYSAPGLLSSRFNELAALFNLAAMKSSMSMTSSYNGLAALSRFVDVARFAVDKLELFVVNFRVGAAKASISDMSSFVKDFWIQI